MPTVTVSLDLQIDSEWIDMCTHHSDLFITGYCGYWMYGMEQNDKLGWLIYRPDDDCSVSEVSDSPDYIKIVADWKAGNPLPEGWHRLNEEIAIKAWVEGVKKFGIDWYENSDADTYDFVIQMALLGEIVYG